jgi:hypothetical protein
LDLRAQVSRIRDVKQATVRPVRLPAARGVFACLVCEWPERRFTRWNAPARPALVREGFGDVRAREHRHHAE